MIAIFLFIKQTKRKKRFFCFVKIKKWKKKFSSERNSKCRARADFYTPCSSWSSCVDGACRRRRCRSPTMKRLIRSMIHSTHSTRCCHCRGASLTSSSCLCKTKPSVNLDCRCTTRGVEQNQIKQILFVWSLKNQRKTNSFRMFSTHLRLIFLSRVNFWVIFNDRKMVWNVRKLLTFGKIGREKKVTKGKLKRGKFFLFGWWICQCLPVLLVLLRLLLFVVLFTVGAWRSAGWDFGY